MDYNRVSLPPPGSLTGSLSPPSLQLSILPPTPSYWHAPNSSVSSFSLHTFSLYRNCCCFSLNSPVEASFLSRHSFAQRPNCLPLESTALGWTVWSLTLFFTNSTLNMKVLLQSEEFPLCLHTSSNISSLWVSQAVYVCHFHTYTTYHPPHYQFEAPTILQRSPTQPTSSTGLPWLCQDPGSSPSPYSKSTIICSVHLTCLKNQFLWELVNIN